MIDLYCIIILILAVIFLGIIIFKRECVNKIFENKIVSCFILVVLLLPPLCLISVFASSSDQKTEDTSQISSNLKIEKIGLNKIIIVGDSRMEYIYEDKANINIPDNFVFDAKSGAKIDWLKEEGLPTLEDALKEYSNYNLHVVFNMGVNDLNDDINIRENAYEYFKYYKNIIKKNKDVEFYLLSVNPVDENIINKFWTNERTNKKIKAFNNYMHSFMEESGYSNITYCNSYDTLKFTGPDGLHYNRETNERIVNFIKNDCIKYK